MKGGSPLPFFDDVEAGPGDWTADGFWHRITNPQSLAVSSEINPRLVLLPDAAGQLPSAFSGSSCWWYGEDTTGTFIGNDFDRAQANQSGGASMAPNTGSLVSPPLDLAGVAAASLSFQTWWEIEGVDADHFDIMHVEVSTDGGEVFTALGTGRINPANDANGESWRPYSSGGLGAPGLWIRQAFDLSPFAGNEILIRFRFNTVDSAYNGFRGWFIDDISVTSGEAPGPKINRLDPSSGRAGSLVYVIGQDFANGARVRIGNITATTEVFSSERADFFVPPLPDGTYDVAITNPDGMSDMLHEGFRVTSSLPPVVISIQPNTGNSNQSTPVSITGENFAVGAVASVGDVTLANIVRDSSFTLTGVVAPGLSPGFKNVVVTNPDSQYDILVGGFQVMGAQGVQIHPGFEEGVPLGERLVQSSIGIGDVDQDGLNEIIVGGADGSLYGYNGDGSPVISEGKGLKLLHLGSLFDTPDGSSILSSPTLADIDFDRRVDIFFGTDGGQVYHLELSLSSDIATQWEAASFLERKSKPEKKASDPEEGDDTGR